MNEFNSDNTKSKGEVSWLWLKIVLKDLASEASANLLSVADKAEANFVSSCNSLHSLR